MVLRADNSQSEVTSCNPFDGDDSKSFFGTGWHNSDGYAEFYVTLQSSADYMSFDVGRKNSSAGSRDGATGAIHASKFVTQCGTWKRHDNNEFQDKDGDRIQIRFRSSLATKKICLRRMEETGAKSSRS